MREWKPCDCACRVNVRAARAVCLWFCAFSCLGRLRARHTVTTRRLARQVLLYRLTGTQGTREDGRGGGGTFLTAGLRVLSVCVYPCDCACHVKVRVRGGARCVFVVLCLFVSGAFACSSHSHGLDASRVKFPQP